MSSKQWINYKWGKLCTLEYGKGLKGYRESTGKILVYGTNGPIGFTEKELSNRDGVIIGRKGAYRGVHYSPKPFFVIDTAFYLNIIDESKLDMKFAYYNLLTKDINSMDSGSAIPSTSRNDFYNIESNLPSIEEQKAIAHVLSILDGKIEINNQINKKLEEMAQAIFKQWFVDFEFPNEDGEPYKSSGGEMVESEMGMIPKGWSVYSLYDLAEYINGTSFKKDEISENKGIPIIKIAELKQGVSSSTKYCISKKDQKYYLANGDILFSWSGNPETSIDIFIWYRGNGILNQHTFKVVSTIYSNEFMYLILKYFKSIFTQIASNKQTTGLGHVTVSDLKRLKVTLPNKEFINEICCKINSMVRKIHTTNLENNRLSQLRDNLLPKLMSGEIRVPINN